MSGSEAGPTPFDLADRVALVTGGTRGIGAAIVSDLVSAGATVVSTGRDPDVVDDPNVVALAYDAGQAGAPAALAARVAEQVGRLDILVNNAAILRPHRVAKLTEAEFDEVFTTNVKAPVFLSKALHPLLAASSSAAVVNITAACGHHPMGGLGAYCASKAAMLNFTVTLAQEWASDGIRVNALTPGSVATDMILPTDPDRRAAFEQEMGEQNLVGRLAEPDEIAHAVRFLVSPAASYVTGQTLIADGGFLAT